MWSAWPGWVEQGAGLVEALNAAGIRFRIHDGVPQVSDVAAADVVLAGYDPLTRAQAGKVAEVKAEANGRILALAPEWKQRNLLAQGVLLAVTERPLWTAKQVADLNNAQVLWGQIDAVRTASDEIESQINAMTDWAVVAGLDIQNHVGWP